MLARFFALKRSDRLRAFGWLVLGSGVVAAAIFYWIKVRTAEPVLDDSTALGYQRSLQHQIGVMMGQFGVMLAEWQEALTSPTGEALMIVVGSALLAACFFRVAWLADHDGRD